MKKFLLTIMLSTMNLISFAQIYGEFSLPHTTNVDELCQFVGQRVKIPSNYGGDIHEKLRFEDCSYYAKEDVVYTIEKVKANSKTITLYLSDSNGNMFKAKVDANKRYNYKTMTTCESFFLVDKYDSYVRDLREKALDYKFLDESGSLLAQITGVKFVDAYKGLPQPVFSVRCTMFGATFECKSLEEANRIFGKLGTPIMNKDNDTVAVVVGIKEYNDNEYSDDVLIYKFKNVCDNTFFDATMQEATKYALNVGDVFSHPRVKHSYKIVGIESNSKYIVINTVTNQKKRCDTNNVEKYLFDEDLSGKYVSVLSKVEKPSNPSIRYGKTKTVEATSDITRYSYVDNVIDLLIVGDSDKFSFILKNISDNTIKIIWNEAAFVDFDGSTSKVMHAGTKYSQREGDQPATTIIKGAKIEDVAVPTCNIRYSSILEEWVEDSMYPAKPNENPGQIRLMLPIQIKDVVNEYVFVFDVKYVYNHPEALLY